MMTALARSSRTRNQLDVSVYMYVCTKRGQLHAARRTSFLARSIDKGVIGTYDARERLPKCAFEDDNGLQNSNKQEIEKRIFQRPFPNHGVAENFHL